MSIIRPVTRSLHHFGSALPARSIFYAAHKRDTTLPSTETGLNFSIIAGKIPLALNSPEYRSSLLARIRKTYVAADIEVMKEKATSEGYRDPKLMIPLWSYEGAYFLGHELWNRSADSFLRSLCAYPSDEVVAALSSVACHMGKLGESNGDNPDDIPHNWIGNRYRWVYHPRVSASTLYERIEELTQNRLSANTIDAMRDQVHAKEKSNRDDWIPILRETGKNALRSGLWETAYNCFRKLNELGEDAPEVTESLLLARQMMHNEEIEALDLKLIAGK